MAVLRIPVPPPCGQVVLKSLSLPSHPKADVTTQINHLDAQKKILIALPNVCEKKNMSFKRTLELITSLNAFGGEHPELKVLDWYRVVRFIARGNPPAESAIAMEREPAELLPEILGEPPFRQISIRHEEKDYAMWVGQDVKAQDALCALQRIFGAAKLLDEDCPLARSALLPDLLRLEAGEAPALLLRSCSVSVSSTARKPRPPLSDLLQLSTTGTSSAHVHVGICTAYGPRISNQDSYICSADWAASTSASTASAGLFAVCDGHGGATVSEALPPLLPKTLAAALGATGDAGSATAVAEAVEAAFVDADEELRRSLEVSAAERCGSTCAMCMTWPRGGGLYRVMLANLGDSRALLYRHRGDLEHLVSTRDHKPDVPSEKKRIRAAGGYVVPGDDAQPARVDAVLATSRAFGNFRFKDAAQTPGTRKVSPVPDVSILEAKAGDVLVLATDGVLDVLSSSEVIALAVQGLKPTGDAVEAAADVVWAALQANTQDNVTCLVIQLGT
eukprot:s1594_g3.t1